MSSVFLSINRMAEVIKQLKDAGPAHAKAIAEVVHTYAYENVNVLTGFTQESIRTESDGDTVTVFAGGASLFLEYGTVNMPAFPFVRPAIQAGVEAMKALKLELIK